MHNAEARGKQALFQLLYAAPHPNVLLTAIDEGRIDGDQYHYEKRGQDFGCAIGLLAHHEGHSVADERYVGSLVHRSGGVAPIERWLYGVKPGDTAQTSHRLRRMREWVLEWSAANGIDPTHADEIDPEKRSAIEALIEESGGVLATYALLLVPGVLALLI